MCIAAILRNDTNSKNNDKPTHNVFMVVVTDTASPFSARTERCEVPMFSTGVLAGGSLV